MPQVVCIKKACALHQHSEPWLLGGIALQLLRTFLRHGHSGRIFTNLPHKCMNCSKVEVEHPVQPGRVIARLLQFVVVANAEVIGDVEQITLVFSSEERSEEHTSEL